ncbi:hypothetical protein PF004_g21550 [Phytophthora fragariae]|uniref:Uncharacterized protein n=1 Tax=Phytophthora fragariae TaxID=53985 RepID=A0A6G0N4J6_9STRA|nr:hypothetical protein PF004_g21550 [Phytophthora fragariae]
MRESSVCGGLTEQRARQDDTHTYKKEQSANGPVPASIPAAAFVLPLLLRLSAVRLELATYCSITCLMRATHSS